MLQTCMILKVNNSILFSRIPINLNFTANSDKEVNFNLICKIKRKSQPLGINVKGEGYSMNCTLLCEDSNGNKIELTDDGLNEIKFGEVSKGRAGFVM